MSMKISQLLMRNVVYIISAPKQNVKNVHNFKRSASNNIVCRKYSKNLKEKCIEEPPKLQYLICRFMQRSSIYLDPWFLLQQVGVKRGNIVWFRRKLRKFHYPWLAYSLPTGISMAVGDLVAQHYYEDKKKLDLYRTLCFSLIGFLLVGPITSKWKLFWYRKLSRSSQTKYLLKNIILEICFLVPIVSVITMACYDYKVTKESWKDPMKLYSTRYKEPLKEVMKFYIETRPLIAMISCFMLPMPYRKHVRILYGVWLYSVLSNAINRHGLGTSEKPKKVKKDSSLLHSGCLKRLYRALTGSSSK